MILFISDFDLSGSGYMNIAVSLCNELSTRHGFDVTAIGIGYDMSEHNWPFSILPVEQSSMMGKVPAMVYNLKVMGEQQIWKPLEAIIIALDIPMHELLLQMDRGTIPYIGVLPIESGPLCASWASTLAQMNDRLIISEFGTKMVKDFGLDATYLPVGIDTESWRPPGSEERKAIRKSLGFTDDDFVVLTVADNQERKNLSAAMEILSKARSRINAKWILVSRLQSPVGWKLNDLAASFDMTDHFIGFDRGLPFDRLWILYAAADAFLLTSKAEGLCLPVLESMATETPVLAHETTAIPEHIYQDPDWSRVRDGVWGRGRPRGRRGYRIPVEYSIIDPWGNSVRSFPNMSDAAKRLVALSRVKKGELKKVTDRGREYAMNRNWSTAGEILARSIRGVIAQQAQSAQLEPASGLPASQPRPIPPMYNVPDTGGFNES